MTTDFVLPDAAWQLAAAEIAALGKMPEAERSNIEMFCELLHLSIVAKQAGPAHRPVAQAKAWERVASEAERLLAAIAGLDSEGAVGFHFFDEDGHFSEQLRSLPEQARAIAALNRSEEARPNRANPTLEWAIEQLVDVWTRLGGERRASVIEGRAGGPLIRFLDATIGEAVEAAGEKRPTKDALRDYIRKPARHGG